MTKESLNIGKFSSLETYYLVTLPKKKPLAKNKTMKHKPTNVGRIALERDG